MAIEDKGGVRRLFELGRMMRWARARARAWRK
jgi:hypothetical protein